MESAWKLARQFHQARGERRWKAVSRRLAYHGTTMGALSINGIAALRTPFEPLVPRRDPRAQHEPLSPSARGERRGVHGVPARGPRVLDRAGGPRDRGDGDHGAGAERGRRVHAAGGLLARRTRDLRPLRDPPLRGRGDHRLRAARQLVRRRSSTTSGRTSDDVREGAVVRLCVDRRRRRGRPHHRAVPRATRRCTRTESRSAAIRCSARSRSRTSRSCDANASSRTCATTAAPSAPRSSSCSSCRSSATCAERASSTPSSS